MVIMKLHSLRHGRLCVNDYIRKFETVTILHDVNEPKEHMIMWFITTLKFEIVPCYKATEAWFLGGGHSVCLEGGVAT